jgi:hypothetical protein
MACDSGGGFADAGGRAGLWIIVDLLAGHRQHTWIMSVVRPVTALWAGPLAVYSYYHVGRLSTRHRVQESKERGGEPPGKRKPFWQMTGLGVGEVIKAALRADTPSLTAWPIGMYGRMAIAVFGPEIAKTNPVFWCMMQIAMALGFLTGFPVNGWLLKKGIKEEM